jgi:hypothetical protein
VPSLPPFVHDFPYPNDVFRIARRRHTDFFPHICSFPSIWSSGFSPPHCCQCFLGPASLVLSVNLPPSAPPRFGVSSSSRVAVVAGNRRRQNRRASLGKTHHLPVCRPASCQFSSPAIRPCLVTPARCALRTRVLPQASSRHPIAGDALAVLASSFRPVTADHHAPDARRERRPVRHARHTWDPRGKTTGNHKLKLKNNDIERKMGSLKRFELLLSPTLHMYFF